MSFFSQNNIEIAQKIIPICHVRTSGHRMSLRYCPKTMKIIVRLPIGVPIDKSIAWVEQNRPYLEKQLEDSKTYTSGDTISILGQLYTIKTQLSFRDASVIEGQSLYIYHTAPEPDIRTAIQILARQKLLSHIQQQAPLYADLIHETINRITIKDMHSRWGSCSSKGNLNFALKLAFKPLDCINYVIAHEVCHLKHMNHSADFWKLVETICPDYRIQRHQLR